MLNSDLPNITDIGNGSEVRAAVAKLVGYAETRGAATASKARLAAFFQAAAVRCGYVAPAPAPAP